MTPPRTCILALALLASASAPALAFLPFHPANTPAEMALDAIIRQSEHDDYLVKYLLRYTGVDARRDQQNLRMLTQPLVTALIDQEADTVYQQCGGEYTKGKTCGLSYNPISCSNYKNRPYIYRTDSEGPDNAVIVYKLPKGTQLIATYDMQKIDGVWKIDGIECTVGASFNM